jgi:hypothetical protein
MALANVVVPRRIFLHCAILLLVIFIPSLSVLAQNVCEIGNKALNPAPPLGITPAEIIRQFSAKESAFKAARDRYAYTVEINVQTLTVSGRIDGQYRQVSEIMPGRDGTLQEKVTFAPQSTLRRIGLTQDDLDDIRFRLPVAITSDVVPFYSIEYVGQQHVDQLETYVFSVAPKDAKHEKKLFAGRIWVDAQDLMIVKTCGKPHPDGVPKKKGPAYRTPMFVTYREQVDGKLWFATYAKADEFVPFPLGDVHIREVIRYSDYRSLTSK